MDKIKHAGRMDTGSAKHAKLFHLTSRALDSLRFAYFLYLYLGFVHGLEVPCTRHSVLAPPD